MSRGRGFSIKILDTSDDSVNILFKNVPVEIINSIRRISMSEVPTLAIDKVFIFRNDSVLNDQMLAHRLGLIPLKTPVDKYKYGDEEGKPEYVSLSLTIEAKNGFRTVYAKDIKSNDKEVYPLYEDIEIVRLAPGEGLDIEMWAIMGTGREHAKWSPVTVCVVRGVPVIKILKECDSNCKKCVEACPKNILKVNNGKLTVTNLYLCTGCKLCEVECPDCIKVDIDERSSLFMMEIVGQLTIKTILTKSFDILISKIDDFLTKFNEVEIYEDAISK